MRNWDQQYSITCTVWITINFKNEPFYSTINWNKLCNKVRLTIECKINRIFNKQQPILYCIEVILPRTISTVSETFRCPSLPLSKISQFSLMNSHVLLFNKDHKTFWFSTSFLNCWEEIKSISACKLPFSTK